MARQSRFNRKGSGPKKAFQLSSEAPLVQFYAGGTKARVRVVESYRMPLYDVDSDAFVTAIGDLASAGYRDALAASDSSHAAAIVAALAGERFTPPAPVTVQKPRRARPTNTAPTAPRPHPVSEKKLRRRRRNRPGTPLPVGEGTSAGSGGWKAETPARTTRHSRRLGRSERKAAAKEAKRRARAAGERTTHDWRSPFSKS